MLLVAAGWMPTKDPNLAKYTVDCFHWLPGARKRIAWQCPVICNGTSGQVLSVILLDRHVCIQKCSSIHRRMVLNSSKVGSP
jgi:hypothetical protein